MAATVWRGVGGAWAQGRRAHSLPLPPFFRSACLLSRRSGGAKAALLWAPAEVVAAHLTGMDGDAALTGVVVPREMERLQSAFCAMQQRVDEFMNDKRVRAPVRRRCGTGADAEADGRGRGGLVVFGRALCHDANELAVVRVRADRSAASSGTRELGWARLTGRSAHTWHATGCGRGPRGSTQHAVRPGLFHGPRGRVLFCSAPQCQRIGPVCVRAHLFRAVWLGGRQHPSVVAPSAGALACRAPTNLTCAARPAG